MATAATEGLFDREAELALLRAALADARDSRGRLVIVEGEPGIGKTALLATVLREATGGGCTVLAATGGELERAFAWGVVRQLFEPLVYGASGRRSLLRGAASLARPVLGVTDADAAVAGGDSSFAAQHGLYWLTANLVDDGPAVIVVDDAHWADPASLQFLIYLSRRCAELPVLVVVGLRPAEPGAPEALLRALRGLPRSAVLEPSGLSQTAVRALIERRLASLPGAAFLRASLDVTGGNPFLLEELLRALGEDAWLPDDQVAARVRALGPRSIGHAVLGRLATMQSQALALARAVAVLEVDADLGTAAVLAEIDVAEAQAAADTLIAAQVFASELPLRFAHPILRQAVYADLPIGWRSNAHTRAARALEERGADADRVVVHLLTSDPSGDESAVRLLRGAAERALARGAPDAATSLLERALAEPPDADRRGSLLFELGHAERCTGRLDAAVGHLREALACTRDAAVREAISRELATGLTTGALSEQGLEVLERAVEDCPEDELERRLRLEGDLAMVGISDDDLTRRSAARAARTAAGLTGATPAERVLLGALAYWRATSVAGSAEETADLAERALAGGRMLQEQTPDGFNYVWTVLALLWADRDEAASRYWNQGMDDARASGSGTALVNASIALGRLHMFRGEVAEAEAAARLVEQVTPHIHYPYGAYAVATNLMLPLVERGELEEAESVLGRYGLCEGQPPPIATGQTMLYGRIVLRTAEGRYAEAADDAAELLRRHAVRGYAGLPHGAAIVRALLHAGLRERAREVAAEQLRIAERWGAPSFLGIAQRSLGLAADGDEGPRLLEASVATLEPTSSRLELARSLTALGAALRRRNRRVDAREPLRRALDLAGSCHAEALATEVRDQLRACGARPRRLMLSGVESLTPTERRVAALVADGLSNPEVAQTMFVTRGTVETHLGSIYRKLDIASRESLAVALGENLREAP